jgi:hypothetical protein
MTKRIYYKKVGGRYKPVLEHDYELYDAMPEGNHLIMCYPGGRSTRYNIDPAYAPMIAAGRVAEDAISNAIRTATDMRPNRAPITPAQREAWENLIKEFGDEAHMLKWPSAREACEEVVKAMQVEAEKLLENPAVRKAYDHFLVIAELTKIHN